MEQVIDHAASGHGPSPVLIKDLLVFLIATGVRMLWASDHAPDLAKNPAVRWISNHMRVTPELHAEKFFVKVPDEKTGNLVRAATPLFLALVLISLLLVFSLRSWRMGLISLLPNIAPAAIGFGIWGLYSGEINLGLSVVAGISLGIIVDDTVHFLAKYQHARQEGRNADHVAEAPEHQCAEGPYCEARCKGGKGENETGGLVHPREELRRDDRRQ